MSDLHSKKHNVNPLSVFALSPTWLTFENQEKGERIILLLRAHLITLFGTFLTAITLMVIPFVIFPILGLLNLDLELTGSQILLINVFWYMLTFTFVFYRFIFWYFNIYLLTNERIIDFDFLGVLHKKVSYANLRQIEDVTPKTVGFAGTFFNFGDVFIQTAGEQREFDFANVEKPELVAEKIFEQVRKEELEAPGEVA